LVVNSDSGQLDIMLRILILLQVVLMRHFACATGTI